MSQAERGISERLGRYFRTNSPYIGYPQRFVRIAMEKVITPFLNTRILNSERLKEADRLLKSGVGLVINANHISKRETFEIFRFPFATPEMRKRECAVLVALHQQGLQAEIPSALAHSKILYIPTDQTKEEFAKQGKTVSRKEEVEMLTRAMDDASEILENGGFVILFGQGSRRPNLYDPNNPRALYTLYNRACIRAHKREQEEPNFGIMCIAVEVGQENLSPGNFDDTENEDGEVIKKGFKNRVNRSTLYTYHIGHANSVGALLEKAGGKPQRLDGVCLDEIASLLLPGSDYTDKSRLLEAEVF